MSSLFSTNISIRIINKRKLSFFSRRLEADLEEERNREEMRLADREAERAAKRLKEVQEQEAAKQLAMAQRGLTEDEKEVGGMVGQCVGGWMGMSGVMGE